jgi:hypothetical protein
MTQRFSYVARALWFNFAEAWSLQRPKWPPPAAAARSTARRTTISIARSATSLACSAAFLAQFAATRACRLRRRISTVNRSVCRRVSAATRSRSWLRAISASIGSVPSVLPPLCVFVAEWLAAPRCALPPQQDERRRRTGRGSASREPVPSPSGRPLGRGSPAVPITNEPGCPLKQQ